MDELKAGDVLKGRYRIEKTIGQGAMASVYMASDVCLQGARWAAKVVALEGLSRQDRIEATALFRHEVELLDRLRHPGLPRLVDAFSEDGRHLMVMELIPGETLDDLLARRRAPFSEGELLPLLRQLASVLQYLHTREPHPVIFRDLKPSNCMVTPDGKLQLIDFGIAREHKPERKTDTLVLGTPGFCAPEQYGSAQTEPRSDLWSLGAMAWHLLSGRDPAEVGFAFPPLRQVAPSCSDAMEGIMSRCLAIEIEERYPSAAELLADLDYAASPRAVRDALSRPRSPGLASPSPARIGLSTRRMSAVPLEDVPSTPTVLARKPFVPVRPVQMHAPAIDPGPFLRAWASRTFRIWWGPGSIHFPRILALLLLMFFLLPFVTAVMHARDSDDGAAQQQIECDAQVSEIRDAIEAYASAHRGLYPAALSQVFPDGVPACPATGQDEYSRTYVPGLPQRVHCQTHQRAGALTREDVP